MQPSPAAPDDRDAPAETGERGIAPGTLQTTDDAEARRRALDEQEVAAAARRARRVFAYGAAVWAAGVSLDWVAARHATPSPFGHLLALRAAGTAAIGAARWSLARRRPSRRALWWTDLATHTTVCALVALMALRYGGFASPYAHAVTCVLLARGVAWADRWQRGAALFGVPALAYPAVLLGSLAASPTARAQLGDAAAMGLFAQHMIWVGTAFALLTLGGHVVWSLRREIAEARSVGRYKLRERLGGGGMGEVWRAWHHGLKREVAVKILKPSVSSQGSAVERFEREVAATAELAHPNTVRVFDYGATDDGLWYYVMELLEGETLSQRVRRDGPLAPPRAVHYALQAAEALAEAHAHTIVHRDVKPENLFLTTLGGERDAVKLLDFGIMKREGDAAQGLTRDDALLGTPQYMAPEQVMGEAVTARSDVYALGATLFFALTGTAPFQGANSVQVMLARVQRPADSLASRLGRPLPDDLEALVARCLRQSPAERYADAGAVAEALRACAAASEWAASNDAAPGEPWAPGAEASVTPPERSGERARSHTPPGPER